MVRLKAFLTIMLLASAACSDANSPDVPMALAKRRTLLDAPVATTSSTTDSASREPSPIKLAEWAPPLTTYDTTFIAVQGKPSTHAIFFQQQPWMTYPVKYMELNIPPGAEFVDADGMPVPRGTIVPITVHADSGVISFEFGPHGSSFSERKPATLSVWWLFADLGSLSAAGLQVWYQGNSTEPWNALTTQIDLAGAYLEAPIYHFSNYAVAW